MEARLLCWCLMIFFGLNSVSCFLDRVSVRERREAEESISEQVKKILEHYKQDDPPPGIPGAPVPDPMPIPDMKQSFPGAKMTFSNVKVYGLSKFRVDHVKSDLAALQLSSGLRIERLELLGNYTMSTWLSRSRGPFNVTLVDVYVEGLAMLEVDRAGMLFAEDIKMDIRFRDIMMKFDNLGFMAAIFQGFINSVGSFLFESIKPFILSEVNTNVRGDVNKHIANIPFRFPNSISPLDMAIAKARQEVRKQDMDPFHLPNYTSKWGSFEVDISHGWLTGLSSFYRVGNISLTMENNTGHADLNVGTQKLEGKCHWDVSFGIFSRAGTLKFTVAYLDVHVEASQPLNVDKKPSLDGLDVKLGNIQVRMDGAGTMDYITEFLVNVIPNILRYQIMNALENPIRVKVQDILNSIDVEKTINDHLNLLDEHMQ